MKFKKTNSGLYVYYPNFKVECKKAMEFVITITENKTLFIPQQFKRAKCAIYFCHTVRTLSIKDYKTLIIINAMRKNPVTIKDIQIAKQILGLDIGSLKGKTMHKKRTSVVQDCIKISQELVQTQQEITLCMDAINSLLFMTKISKNLYYCERNILVSKTN